MSEGTEDLTYNRGAGLTWRMDGSSIVTREQESKQTR